MRKKCMFIGIAIFFAIVLFSFNVYATDLDVIQSFIITASPRDDATVDFSYQIRWKVLDSTSQGPLSWVEIGLPNSYAESIKARTDNIASIRKNGEYVRIEFDDEYEAGEVITFAFTFNQPYLCKVKNGKVIYEYTPAWFDDCKVNNLVISWDGEGTIKSNNNKTEGDLLVWEKENLAKKQKLKIEVQYDESYFSNVDTDKPKKTSSFDESTFKMIVVIVIIVVVMISSLSTPSYRRHSGYYGSTYIPRYHRTMHNRPRYRSHSSIWDDDDFGSFGGFGGSSGGSSRGSSGGCACACACAGSGRAGCSKKDFYGTKLKSKMLIEELEK